MIYDPRTHLALLRKCPPLSVSTKNEQAFLKLPREVVVNRSSFLLSNCWVVTDRINKQGLSHFLSKLRSLSNEQQFLGNSRLLSKANQFTGRISKRPYPSAPLVPELEDSRCMAY